VITGQRVELDEPCAGTCHLAGHDESKPRQPCRDIMLSGWPDSLTACDSCAADLIRLKLDLTRDCALCGGPLRRYARNGRVDGYKGCFCSAETSRLERRVRKLMPP
jgi:hypothetical protein